MTLSLRRRDKTQEEIDLDNELLEYAQDIAQSSHDSKTQVGAVVYKPGHFISTGYNSFPPTYNYGPIDMRSDFKHPRIERS